MAELDSAYKVAFPKRLRTFQRVNSNLMAHNK